MSGKKVWIIGAGPAGLAAAREAARLGADVTILDSEDPGGRAVWHSLLPSKIWLGLADWLGEVQQASHHGLELKPPEIDPQWYVERLGTMKSEWGKREADRLEALGIKRLRGKGRVVGERTLLMTAEDGATRHETADVILVASGSVPIFPTGLKPDGKRILAPRMMSSLSELPKSLIVIGGGVTGSETLYLFNRLGTRVTAVTDRDQLLPRSDRDVSDTLESIFVHRGVDILKSSRVREVVNRGEDIQVALEDGRTLEAEMAFVAIGRRPDLSVIDSDRLAVSINSDNGIAVDGYGQSVDHPWLYAVGDSVGAPMLANRAMEQGRLAARHAVLGDASIYQHDRVIEAIYTQPQVASVGLSRQEADERNVPLCKRRATFADNMKAFLSHHQEGFIKVFTDPDSDRILGAAAVADHAADLLMPVAVAMHAGLTFDAFRHVVPANPTLSEIYMDLERAE